jgi:hypothetical protein
MGSFHNQIAAVSVEDPPCRADNFQVGPPTAQLGPFPVTTRAVQVGCSVADLPSSVVHRSCDGSFKYLFTGFNGLGTFWFHLHC